MIKINLLSEGRKPVVARQPRFQGLKDAGGDFANLALVAATVLGLLIGLGQYYLLGRALAAKEAEVAEAQKEVDELAPIIKEVEEFKAKKAELERKVQVINDLKQNQRGPVQIMDEVSLALPELLWLNRMNISGQTVTLAGQAFNTNAVANFIENLDGVPQFQEPILKDAAQSGAFYRFVITFKYTFRAPSEGVAASPAVAH